ncbi:MAG: phenylacetic acid degradation operon negative regulatory protein PaaX [Hydrogenibacillus schlegelii]|uniref:Phenylacetic acid degradation operon negative regulatory protein PaaX n=1 Tax=Hydrogenibacillus schlegelii TaxID=1484 RepID=A0A947CW68_HYDSH|nr:phenylacetic acid degradation operon negative regulatory protein PaaX [Hydrogenibacillus schlegelii]
MFTIIGDFYRNFKMEVWVGSLIKYLEPFGYTDGAVRVTLSRMMRQGWLESKKVGQKSYYRLTAKGIRRLKHGTKRVYQPMSEHPWDGKWRLVLHSFPDQMRNVRERVRKELQWMGFGYLGNNVWITPNNLYAEVMEMIEEYGIKGYIDFFTATYEGPQLSRDIVHKAWDLEEIAAKYEHFVASFQLKYEKLYRSFLEETLTEEMSFVERVLLVHEYRKFLFVDPNLPRELLPADWVGDEAARLFKEMHRFLTPLAERYFYRHLDAVGIAPRENPEVSASEQTRQE